MLGWTSTNCDYKTVFLEADEWGVLKRKIGEERNNADILVFKGGDEELNRKCVEDPRLDVLLHPEKGRKDSGINHVIAEEAAKNQVAIGFDFSELKSSEGKKRTHILSAWRRNLKLCDKYNTPYIITSGASEIYGLRSPKDLASVIESLGFEGEKAVSVYPSAIVRRFQTEKEDGFVSPGVKKEVDEE